MIWPLAGAQTDLRVEAVHLRRFYNNFAAVRSSVTPPLPVPGMATEAVLVETFEAGQALACPFANRFFFATHIPSKKVLYHPLYCADADSRKPLL